MEYRVTLDHFAGPLDLLLHLVKKQEVDIHDIPIAKILEQYLQYLKLIQDLDLDEAGEFLVMAATLMVIKSRMLLPAEEIDLGEDIDPRYELVQQLLEFKRIKDASAALEDRSRAFGRMVGRPESARPEPVVAADRSLEEVSLFDLLEAFSRILESLGPDAGRRDRRIRVDDVPVRIYVQRLGERLKTTRAALFSEILGEGRDRAEVVGYFLAILLLLKKGTIMAAQAESFSDIRLLYRGEPEGAEMEIELADDFR